MSYTVVITITCDEPGCDTTFSRGVQNEGGLTKTFAGALAANAGWAIPGRGGSQDPKKAWCPEHAADKINRREDRWGGAR